MPLNGTTRDATTAVKGKIKLATHLGGTADAPTIAWTYNPYCFRAYDSGGTTLTDGSAVKINLATENYDFNNNFATSTYAAPVAGVYHFDAALEGSALTGAVAVQAFIYKNGAAAIHGPALFPTTAGVGASVSGDILLAAGDTIDFYVFQNTAGNETSTTGSEETWMSGHLVHRTA